MNTALSVRDAHEIAEEMYYVMTGDPYLTEENAEARRRIFWWLRARGNSAQDVSRLISEYRAEHPDI